MADFVTAFDPKDLMGGLLKMENSSLVEEKMVNAGLDILVKSIEKGAKKHIDSGRMSESVYKTNVYTNKYGDIVGHVGFAGSDGKPKKSKKTGKRFDRSNWIKAFRIEYGTSTQSAKPFVRPAIVESKSQIQSVMEKVFDEEVGK